MFRSSTDVVVRALLGVGICGAGVFGAALVLSPQALGAPLKTGGYACIQDQAGAVAGNPAAPAACAPVADMAGVPMTLPGPVPVGAPVVPVVVPVVPAVPPLAPPVVPVVPPLASPVVPVAPVAPPVVVPPVVVPPVVGAPVVPMAGAPIIDMAGAYGGKGAPTAPPPAGGPAPGEPILPGPSPAG